MNQYHNNELVFYQPKLSTDHHSLVVYDDEIVVVFWGKVIPEKFVRYSDILSAKVTEDKCEEWYSSILNPECWIFSACISFLFQVIK